MKTLCTLFAAALLAGCSDAPDPHEARIRELEQDVVRLERGVEDALRLIATLNTNQYHLGTQQTTTLINVAADLADLRLFVLTNSATQSELTRMGYRINAVEAMAKHPPPPPAEEKLKPPKSGRLPDPR